MLRIRYEDHPVKEDWIISVQSFVSERTGARYKVLINYKNMEFAIRNERNKEFCYKSNKYTNKNAIRRAARNKLKSLGVSMGRESRKRTFGRCEKGFTEIKNREIKQDN